MNLKEKNWLQSLYLEDLAKVVNYGGGNRPRVRHPNNWVEAGKALERTKSLHHNLMESEQEIWMWSDQHFFHKNIIDFSERPYPDVETMNEHMVANYNDYVGPNDVCIWGGDVGFGNDTQVNELLEQCNGYKILVVGNHDFNKRKVRNLNFDEVHLTYLIDTPEVALFFTHYPMDNIPHPYVNVHGHLHVFPTLDTGHPRHVNINCEGWGYKPVNLKEITRIARNRLIATDE